MMGRGAMSSYLHRLRINTRSSTETELVTVDRYMPDLLWTMYFLREQGHPVELSKIAQDNQAAQLLETKGKFSSTGRTKHIKNKYFFVKDQVDQGEVAIVDCPTEDMWADFFAKAQNGQLFRRMRAVVMGCPEHYVDPLDPSPACEESVRDTNIRRKERRAELKLQVQRKVPEATPPVLKTSKPRLSVARPSPQECVGREMGDRSPNRQTFVPFVVESRLSKRGRLWSEVVAGRAVSVVKGWE